MSGTITATPPGVTPYPRPAVGWYATVVLALLYWFSVLDRFIIGLMVDPIKRDLGLTDLQFGILHGSAFAITFSVVGLLAGALADRYNRRWVIYAGVTIWRSEEHTSELQSLMRISYAVFCLKKKKNN